MKRILTLLLVLMAFLLPLSSCLNRNEETPVNSSVLEKLHYKGLKFYETVGGHTIRRHVGRDYSWLVGRLKKEPRLKYASSFYDYETAEKVVEAAISQNAEKIKNWLSNPGSPDKLVLIYRGKRPIGIRVKRGKDHYTEAVCRDARIVLKKDRRFGFIVLTAYPT